jgi:transposase-like protein
VLGGEVEEREQRIAILRQAGDRFGVLRSILPGEGLEGGDGARAVGSPADLVQVEADETHIGGPRSGRPGRGALGKTVVAGAVQRGRGRGRGRRLGRLRLSVVPDASAASLEGFVAGNLEEKAAVTTDGWSGYRGLAAKGYAHDAINLSRSWGEASVRLPAIHLVFGLAKRWLLGTHHGAVRTKHLQAYLDEYVFRFNRRTAKSIAHRFGRLIQHAVQTPPTTYRAIVAGVAA